MKFGLLIIIGLQLLTINGRSEDGLCKIYIKQTRKICENTQIVNQLVLLLKTIQAKKSVNTIKQACEMAGQLSQFSIQSNLSFAQQCGAAARKCEMQCARAVESSVCEDYKERAQLASLQVFLSALSLSQSKACVNAVSGKVHTHKQSQATFGNLNSNIESIHPAESNTNVNLDLPENAGYEFSGNEIKSEVSKANQVEKNSATFGAGSSSSSPIDNHVPSLNSDKFDKEILKPSSYSENLSNYQNNNQAQAYAGNHQDEEYKFNLKDFLPKGTRDPARNIAGAGYADKTITPANGLTNFQKITRTLNERRHELMP